MFVDVSVACELVSCPAEETARSLSIFISDDKATLQYMSMLKSICWKAVTQVHVQYLHSIQQITQRPHYLTVVSNLIYTTH